nr:hypothetical protein Iba_chr06bCG13070 [Ipomoea batatas]
MIIRRCSRGDFVLVLSELFEFSASPSLSSRLLPECTLELVPRLSPDGSGCITCGRPDCTYIAIFYASIFLSHSCTTRDSAIACIDRLIYQRPGASYSLAPVVLQIKIEFHKKCGFIELSHSGYSGGVYIGRRLSSSCRRSLEQRLDREAASLLDALFFSDVTVAVPGSAVAVRAATGPTRLGSSLAFSLLPTAAPPVEQTSRLAVWIWRRRSLEAIVDFIDLRKISYKFI